MSENVTIRDGFTLAALAAACRPASEVASVAGVSERTVRRWNRKPSFTALVNRLREGMLDGAMGKLLAANGEAVDAMTGLLASANEQVRLGAATRLLQLTLQVRNQLDTQRRLEVVEEFYEELLSNHPSLFRSAPDVVGK